MLDCRHVSILSDMDLAPESLLRIIHCNCKTGRTTNHCSFVKYGNPCTLDNQNREFSVEAWLSMQILHVGTIEFPIEWKNERLRSSLDWFELLWMFLFCHFITIWFAKNNFPSDKVLVNLFSNFIWRPFCFWSHNSAPPTTIFLDLFWGLLRCLPTQKYQFRFYCSFFPGVSYFDSPICLLAILQSQHGAN